MTDHHTNAAPRNNRAAAVLGASVLALAVLAVPGGTARPSTVLRMGNRVLSERAHVIIHGRCTEARSNYSADGRIYTDYRFAVEEWLKNHDSAAGGGFYSFRQWGGQIGDRGMLVAGAARFEVGEEVVAFCDAPQGAEGQAFTIGLSQGKFSVDTDEASGERVVHRDLTGLSLVNERGRRVLAAARTQGHAPRRTLGTLLGEIRGHIGR